jgi:hypothetical protein
LVIDAALKHAPAGSEGAVAAFKIAVAAGQNAFESVQASTKTAVAAAEKNFAAATDMAVKAYASGQVILNLPSSPGRIVST